MNRIKLVIAAFVLLALGAYIAFDLGQYLTLEFVQSRLASLQAFRDEILAQADLALSDIRGLTPEQAPTFASGVAILLALFELLLIKQLHLAGGALREGVLQNLADAQANR